MTHAGPAPAPHPSTDPGPDADTWVVGLDIGGTKIAAGVVGFPSGLVLSRRVIPTGAGRGGDAVLADALALARELMAEGAARGLSVRGIGVGVAELVDPTGTITSAHTIAWRGRSPADDFSRLAPAAVESDVRAAALAEAGFGAGRAFGAFAYVTIGTGISSCLVQDGRPYAGARGNALVLASAPLSAVCPRCGAEAHPILEDIAAGPALVARYNRLTSGGATRGQEVTAAAAAGDAAAVAVVRTAGEALGVGVGFLVNVLDPEAVVVGGGLGLAGGLYWESFLASARRHIWADNTRDLSIIPAALGADAGIVGAAASWRTRTLHQIPSAKRASSER